MKNKRYSLIQILLVLMHDLDSVSFILLKDFSETGISQLKRSLCFLFNQNKEKSH